MTRHGFFEVAIGLPLVITLAVGACPGSARAQATPVGMELQVNSYTTASQSGASVVPDGAGGAFVVWQSADAQDGDRNGVFGRRVGSNGMPAGDEFQVNTTTYLSQSRPDAASDAAGNFIVVWESSLQDGDNSAVVGQRFDSSGAVAGTEFIINTATAGNQFNAHVGRADDGRFVVIWVDSGGLDGDGRGVFARRYDAGGAPSGGQFQVNTYTTSGQDYPDAAMAPDGSFVVVWTTGSGAEQDGDGQGIIGQRFDSLGDPIGGEFVANSYTTGNQLNASVTATPDGGFAITWDASGGQDGDSIGVFGRLFDASGAPLGDDIQVNSFTTGLQFRGRPAPQAGGGLVVTWASLGQDGDSSGVFGRLFNAAGVGGSEFQVNTTTANSQSSGAVANTGSFLVAWSSTSQDGDSGGIFSQLFDTTPASTTTTMPGGAACGDPTGEGITATDALIILQAAVSLQTCEPCICDVAGGGTVTATDALVALQIALGSQLPLLCPPC